MILILIIPLLWVLFKTNNNYIRVAIIVLFTLWFGIPTFNKWRADKLVDELCAKDGGIKVYETVTLRKERFNQWGQFDVWDRPHMKPNDEYYSIWKTKDVVGSSGSSDILSLTVFQSSFWVYRLSNQKLLGESVAYARRGGDAIGPWMPSSYSCSKTAQSDLINQIFLKLN